MKSKTKQLKNLFLVIRPYSLVDIILLAILGNVLVMDILKIDTVLLLDMFYATIWWTTVLFFTEYRKNKDVDIKILIIFTALLLGFTIYRNILAIILIALNAMLLYCYMLKSKKRIFALLSPIFRALLSLILLLLVITFHNSLNISFIYENLNILVAISMLVMARNLEGDVRDMKTDRYSLAIQLGKKRSRLLIVLLVVLASVIIFNITALPLLLFGIIIVLTLEGPSLHRIFVLTTMFFAAGYILYYIGNSPFIVFLLFIGVLLNFTYNIVPRTSVLVKRNLRNLEEKVKDEFLINHIDRIPYRYLDKKE